MATTWFEEGVAKGREKERREMVRELLEDRFGQLSAQAIERLQSLSMERLKELRRAILRVQSLQELGLDD